MPAHHGFSVHPEHHLFLHLTVEELKHPLRLLLFYTPCANHLSLGTAVSEHGNTHFHHTYLLCTTSHIRSPWSIRKETWSTLTTNLVHTEDYLGPRMINMVHVVMATMQTSSTVLTIEEFDSVIMFLIAIMILINTLVITILIYSQHPEAQPQIVDVLSVEVSRELI